MGEFDEATFAYRTNLHIDKQDGLEVLSFRVVSELFNTSRDFNELGFVWFKPLSVVFGVRPFLRRNRRKVGHCFQCESTGLFYKTLLLVNSGKIYLSMQNKCQLLRKR